MIFPCNSLKYIIVLYLAKMGLHTVPEMESPNATNIL